MLVTITANIEWNTIDSATVEQIQAKITEIIKDGCQDNFAWSRYINVELGGGNK